ARLLWPLGLRGAWVRARGRMSSGKPATFPRWLRVRRWATGKVRRSWARTRRIFGDNDFPAHNERTRAPIVPPQLMESEFVCLELEHFKRRNLARPRLENQPVSSVFQKLKSPGGLCEPRDGS